MRPRIQSNVVIASSNPTRRNKRIVKQTSTGVEIQDIFNKLFKIPSEVL